METVFARTLTLEQETIERLRTEYATQDERKRIVAGWVIHKRSITHRDNWRYLPYDHDDYCDMAATLLGISEDTVREVLREEGE